jgi:hypothetical protein
MDKIRISRALLAIKKSLPQLTSFILVLGFERVAVSRGIS